MQVVLLVVITVCAVLSQLAVALGLGVFLEWLNGCPIMFGGVSLPWVLASVWAAKIVWVTEITANAKEK